MTAESLGDAYAALRHHRRIVLLTDGYSTPFLAKTAINLIRYRASDIAAVIDREAAGRNAKELFQMACGEGVIVVASLAEVPDPDALYVGIAPPGGRLPAAWRSTILEALRRPIDVVSGLHDFLHDDAEYREASKLGGKLIDVRRNQLKLTATGAPFRHGCVRIHTVGHDCSVGKMVVTVELESALKARGADACFLATGQTGIMISGAGVPIDCVVSDFVNGAAETLVRENEAYDFLLVEGQGSITHPAYSAVTLGLLHGCAPDGMIFCYEAGREFVKGFDNLRIPPLEEQIAALETMANLRHPCKMLGVAVNTRTLSDSDARAEIAKAEDRFGLPACDVYRTGANKLVDACLRLREGLLGKIGTPETSQRS